MAEDMSSQGTPPQPPAPPVYQPKQGASGLAIASLVMGIAGIFCCAPLSIGALITGIIEKNNIKAGTSSQAGQGIATAGFIMGIIGIVLIVLMIIASLIWSIVAVNIQNLISMH
jgi:hypothetical protein